MLKMLKENDKKGDPKDFPLKDDSGKDLAEEAKTAMEKAKAQVNGQGFTRRTHRCGEFVASSLRVPLFRQIYRLTKRKRQRKRSQRQRPRKPPRSCRSELKFVFVFMCVHAYIVFGSESNIHSHTHHIENPNIPLARTRV